MKNTLANYLVNFKEAYDELLARYLTDGVGALTDEEKISTPEFKKYANAVRAVVKVTMNKSSNAKESSDKAPSNKAMVDSLRACGEYQYEIQKVPDGKEYTVYIIDDVLDALVNHILMKEYKKQYYLNIQDATGAYNAMKKTVRYALCDLIRKIPKTPQETSGTPFKLVPLDIEIVDEEGGGTTVGSLTPDPKQNTEHTVMVTEMVKYAKYNFIHDVVSEFLTDNKPHYLIAYLNNVAERGGVTLYTDITTFGYDVALKNITTYLKEEMDIDVDYLNNMEFKWKKANTDIKRNTVHNWLDESCKIAREVAKKVI